MLSNIGFALAILAAGADPAIRDLLPPAETAQPVAPAPDASLDAAPTTDWQQASCCDSRGFLRSDRAFDRFIGPITNPIYAKDPRSLT